MQLRPTVLGLGKIAKMTNYPDTMVSIRCAMIAMRLLSPPGPHRCHFLILGRIGVFALMGPSSCPHWSEPNGPVVDVVVIASGMELEEGAEGRVCITTCCVGAWTETGAGADGVEAGGDKRAGTGAGGAGAGAGAVALRYSDLVLALVRLGLACGWALVGTGGAAAVGKCGKTRRGSDGRGCWGWAAGRVAVGAVGGAA